MTRNVQKTALFMVLLVISIPLYSAQSFALLQVKSYGRGGVYEPNSGTGYLAPSDSLTLDALIDVSNVAPSQVVVVETGNAFDQCANEGGFSRCKATYPEQVTAGGQYKLSVRYAGQTTADNFHVVDVLEPAVSIISARQNALANVSVTYSVTERSFTESTVCSGIDRVEYAVSGSVVKTTILNFTPGQNCNYQITDGVPVAGSGALSREICVVVYDNVGNQGESCSDVFVDNTPPIARDLQIIDAGNPLNYIAPSRIRIPVQFQFTLVEDNVTSISADLSDFTEVVQLKQNFLNQPVVCSPLSYCNGTCTCTASMEIQLSNQGVYTARINVQDSSGISTQIPLAAQLSIDSESPIVQSIEAYRFNNVNYIGPGSNTIKATISETGSGFTRKNVFLDLSSLISPEYLATPPAVCSLQASNWLCEWRGIPPNSAVGHGDSRKISIVHPSQDDAGNLMQGQEATLVMDKQVPTINSSSTRPFTPGGQTGFPFTVEGDSIYLVMYVKDTLPVRAFADFTSIAGTKVVEGKCDNPVNGLSKCEWLPLPGDTGPARPGLGQRIPVSIADAVGNRNDTHVNVDIYSVQQGTADYWSVYPGGVSPSQIDRQMIYAFSPFVYQGISLYKKQTNVYPADIRVENCGGDSNYLEIGKPELLNANPGEGESAPTPYDIHLRYGLTRGFPPVSQNKISINCTLAIVTKIGSQLSQIERENVIATIEYYNNPLGELSSEVVDAIQNARNSWIFKRDWLDGVDRFVGYAKTLCAVATTVHSVTLLFATVTDIFGSCILGGGGLFCGGAKISFGKGTQKLTLATGKVWKQTQNLCKAINCRLAETTWLENSGFGKFTKNIQDVYETYGAGYLPKLVKGRVGTAQVDLDVPINPEDSIITSALYLCPTGVVYNLKKLREAQCWYISCLLDGYPKFACDKEKSFLQCKWVFGTIFNAIPIAVMLSKIGESIGKMIKEPATIIGFAFDLKCKASCEGVDVTKLICVACKGSELLKVINELSCDLFGKTINGNQCASLGQKFNRLKEDSICNTVQGKLAEFDAQQSAG